MGNLKYYGGLGYRSEIKRADMNNQLVFSGPCALHSILLTSGNLTPSIPIVYDGIDNTGVEIFRTGLEYTNPVSIVFSKPVFLTFGIYISLLTQYQTAYVTFLYKHKSGIYNAST